METFRDAPLGQLIRLVWKPMFLSYPEEREGFQLPDMLKPQKEENDGGKISDEEKRSESSAEKAHDGIVLVHWYGENDPENPQNWTARKKGWVLTVIIVMTWVAYGSSSIYNPSEAGVMRQFDVGASKAALGLALYVLGAGFGPLLWSPLSEIPKLGRNIPYVVPMVIFLVLSIPTAVVNNWSALMFFRFITGFFASPPVATGPASLQDVFPLHLVPLCIAAWLAALYSAVAVCPMMSGYAVNAKDWHWSLWMIVWMAAPALIMVVVGLPETSEGNILLRRAQRLRRLTGRQDLRSQSEITQASMTLNDELRNALIKPLEISLLDPAVMYAHLYNAWAYGTYYTFFESFPIVYGEIYEFSASNIGLSYLPILPGAWLGFFLFALYGALYVGPTYAKKGMQSQEFALKPGLITTIGTPISLFIFGWTARRSIPWIIGMVFGSGLFSVVSLISFLCIFQYLPMSYPQYAASIFAANDAIRSSFAAGAVIFGRPLFVNLGIGRGMSVLAGIGVAGMFGLYGLYWFGASLRKRSRFAVS